MTGLLELMEPIQRRRIARASGSSQWPWREADCPPFPGLVEGPAGYILEAPDDAHRIPDFWFFSLWFLPELDKTYAAALGGPEADLDSIGDHWARLKSKVWDYVMGRQSAADSDRPG